ncbi:uncharacterized protein LOC124155198 [Ischnura elegans]|uniref:uncharacterized protein LOC124155198 n=1 Tax=Ischnura elegans TaxID=197161 RepID=UPI001ED8917D|nr:uncharacterized protein LOC124155198 [Ischnura elegans]
MSKEDIEGIKASGQTWKCSECQSVHRQSLRDSVSSDRCEGSTSLEDVYALIKEMKNELKVTENNLGDSINKLYERLDDSVKIIEEQGKRLDRCYEQISALQNENVQLKKRVNDALSRCDDLEQRALVNSVEIHGVPFSAHENLTQVVCKIGTELGVEIKDEAIDFCYRYKSMSNDKPGGIHVKFVSQRTKEDILLKRRVKRNFSTRHLTLEGTPPTDSPIYINESLCPGRRRLFSAAREAKKTKNYDFLWIRGGKIYLRKAEKHPAKLVLCMDDISKL